jgi:hypothetical protein
MGFQRFQPMSPRSGVRAIRLKEQIPFPAGATSSFLRSTGTGGRGGSSSRGEPNIRLIQQV